MLALISETFGPTQEKETFNTYELNSHRHYFSLNMDECQSSHANWKCDVDYIYLFICLCLQACAMFCLLKIGVLNYQIKETLYLYWLRDGLERSFHDPLRKTTWLSLTKRFSSKLLTDE